MSLCTSPPHLPPGSCTPVPLPLPRASSVPYLYLLVLTWVRYSMTALPPACLLPACLITLPLGSAAHFCNLCLLLCAAHSFKGRHNLSLCPPHHCMHCLCSIALHHLKHIPPCTHCTPCLHTHCTCIHIENTWDKHASPSKLSFLVAWQANGFHSPAAAYFFAA